MTSSEKWQRARTQEQKRERIDSLLGATEVLFDNLRYDDITIAAIAKEAGFTRSNTYKYFSSKEELFLELVKHDSGLWTEDLLGTLREGVNYTPDDFAKIWTGVLLKHFRLIRLFSVLFTKIEKNISQESLLDFKYYLLKLTQKVAARIISIYPQLKPEDVSNFFHLHLVSAIGLFQMSDHTETQKLVMSNEDFAQFRIDFGESCRRSALYLLEGVLRERSQG